MNKINAIGSIAECSTMDIAFGDTELLNQGKIPCLYRNTYGYVVFAHPTTLKTAHQVGASKAFLTVLEQAIKESFRYLVVDQAVEATGKPHASWQEASTKEMLTIGTPEDIKRVVKNLERDELETLAEAVIAGLFLDTSPKEDFINPEKDPIEWDSHLRQNLSRVLIQFPETIQA